MFIRCALAAMLFHLLLHNISSGVGLKLPPQVPTYSPSEGNDFLIQGPSGAAAASPPADRLTLANLGAAEVSAPLA